MKKIKRLFLFTIILLSTQLFAGDRSEVWSRMYKRSVSQELKLSVMLNIVELNDRGMIPLLEEILNSAALVYNIVKETKDPLLKADAIMALGNMRADDYINDIAFILKSLNMRPTQGAKSDIDAEAKVAYGSLLYFLHLLGGMIKE